MLQVMTYVQLLWIEIDGKRAVAYNGAVEAVYTIISMLIFYLSFNKINYFVF